MTEQTPKISKNTSNNQEMAKASSSPKDQLHSRKTRKDKKPIRAPQGKSSGVGHSNPRICKNTACGIVLSMDAAFCKRCSCCICQLYDDNKDPSLWLVCTSDSRGGDSCGLSCHIECALQHEKAGVVNLGQMMQLDGSYCCPSCGKVSGILGCWKKQLSIAKDARRVDVLCSRILLSFRLLVGTRRFAELHDIVAQAKSKLETELGPLTQKALTEMNWQIVNRLRNAGYVQKLCSLAIDKADEWLATVSNLNPSCRVGSLPVSCRFLFEEVTSSSVVIVLEEVSAASSDDKIKGYKLWYCKSRDETYPKEPISVFPIDQRRILVSNLQPFTEYSFQVTFFTDASDCGHSEAKFSTKSVEVISKDPISAAMGSNKDNTITEECTNAKRDPGPSSQPGPSSEFRVRDFAKFLHKAQAHEQGSFEGSHTNIGKCFGIGDAVKPKSPQKEQLPSGSRGLDLNLKSVLDLNDELIPPELSKDEDNNCTSGKAVEGDNSDVSHDTERNGIVRSYGGIDSQNGENGSTEMVPAVDSEAEPSKKRAGSGKGDMNDNESTLINGPPVRTSEGLGTLDENFEFCVKTIRKLECEGHIEKEFRLKLLTWFGLRSTEQERRVVNTYIRTLNDDPVSLAGQLIDSFSDIISNKRPRTAFCGKLWH